jgi:hypothetical protein
MTDPGTQTDEEFGREISKLSADAFQLAIAAVESGDFAAQEAKARELNKRLDDAWPRIDLSPEPAKSALSKDWTDARLDLGYVLSKGELSTSTRLYYALKDRGKA